MIREIEIEKARRFIFSNKKKSSVSFSETGKFYGYFEKGELRGVVSILEMRNGSIRIKSFLVMDIYRGQGIGKRLLDFVFYPFLRYSAFATTDSIELFKSLGFKEAKKNDKPIKYLKYEPV